MTAAEAMTVAIAKALEPRANEPPASAAMIAAAALDALIGHVDDPMVDASIKAMTAMVGSLSDEERAGARRRKGGVRIPLRTKHRERLAAGLRAARAGLTIPGPDGVEGNGPAESASHPRVQHVKRGTRYDVLGMARFQVSTSAGPATVPTRPIADDDPVVVYRGADGQLWARCPDEFNDGRFRPVPVEP